MKGFKFYSILTLLAALGLDYSLAVSAEICNRIVAIVNDEVVTLHELNGKIKELTGLEASEMERQDKEAYIDTRRKILDLLIDEKIVQEKVIEMGIDVTPKEVDAAIEGIKRRNGWTQEELISGLKSKGIGVEQYRNKLKREMEQMRLVDFEVKSKIIVLDEAIKQYYDDHIDEYRSEEKVRLAIILLVEKNSLSGDGPFSLSRKTEEIFSKLKNGEDFGELAKKYSQGPGAEAGGDLGFIKTSQLDPRLREIITNLAEGEVSKPIIGPTGIQIIKVLEKQEKGVKPMEEVKVTIYNVLYNQEINERYSSWIKELREKTYIKITF